MLVCVIVVPKAYIYLHICPVSHNGPFGCFSVTGDIAGQQSSITYYLAFTGFRSNGSGLFFAATLYGFPPGGSRGLVG